VNELLWEKICELCGNPIFSRYKKLWKENSLDCSTFLENLEHFDLWEYESWPDNYFKESDFEPLVVLTLVKQFRSD